MQLSGESEEQLKSDDNVRALVRQQAGIDAFEVERKAIYTFHARVADRWRVGRVFLAGDAAHLMPPFAGQGMNGGMKDAVNLAWKLVAVVRGQASEDILDTYDVERAPIVRQMVEVSRRLGSVIMPTSRIVGVARNCVFACLNTSRRFRAFIARGGFLPPPGIHRSVLTASGRDALIGQMAPQPKVRTAQGESRARSVARLPPVGCARVRSRSALMLSRRDHADPRGAGCALHFSQQRRAGEESADPGPAMPRFRLHRLGQKASAFAAASSVPTVAFRRQAEAAAPAVLNPFAMASIAPHSRAPPENRYSRRNPCCIRPGSRLVPGA